MNEWQMLFNTEKCKVMHLGYNNLKADYVMDGSILYVCCCCCLFQGSKQEKTYYVDER